jgi:hypothetical protein
LILCPWHGPFSAIYGAPTAVSLTIRHAGGSRLPAPPVLLELAALGAALPAGMWTLKRTPAV